MPTVTALKTMFQAQIVEDDANADSEFLRILTEADMRLLLYGRWRWTRKREVLTPVDGIITLPRAYASILGARVDKEAVDLRDEDYEYVPGGPGEVDLGNGYSRLIDQGLDADELRYYKVAGYLDTTDLVTALLYYAPATLYDPTIADSSLPDDAVTVTLCPDATALKLMMLGIRCEESKDLDSARSYMADALRGLDAKEQSQRGNVQKTIQSRPMGRRIGRVRGWR